MLLNEPQSTHRYYGELLASNRSRIFLDGHSLYPYYVSGYALCTVEKLFSERRLDPLRYKPFKYHMLLLFRIQSEPFALPYLNAKKMDEYCSHLLGILSDDAKAQMAFGATADTIRTTLEKTGFQPYVATRLRAFTDEIMAAARPGSKPEQVAATVKRETGEVTMFTSVRGFGFISTKRLGDVFVHATEIRGEGYRSLTPGQKVEFTVAKTERGLQARDVAILP